MIRLLPDFVQDEPERYLKRKFLYQMLACTVYFSVSGYGLYKHDDMLFWLNIPGTGKVIIIGFSIVFLFMGFMGAFMIIGILVNLPFQIVKEIYRTLVDR